MTRVQDAEKTIKALQARAEVWGQMGGPPKERILKQADAAYLLYLDFLEAGQESPELGLDFPRWLSRHSGYCYYTCRNRLKAGRARATGSKLNRNQSGLVAEIRDRELTPAEVPDWDED